MANKDLCADNKVVDVSIVKLVSQRHFAWKVDFDSEIYSESNIINAIQGGKSSLWIHATQQK